MESQLTSSERRLTEVTARTEELTREKEAVVGEMKKSAAQLEENLAEVTKVKEEKIAGKKQNFKCTVFPVCEIRLSLISIFTGRLDKK